MSGDRAPFGELHQRARRGIRLLVGRQLFMQLLAITAGIFVARLLGPSPIGVFGIALFVVNLLTLASDAGIRTALIQQPAPPTEAELQTGFALRQLLAAALVVGVWLAAPSLAALYPQAPAELVWLFRVLGLDLFLRSWRIISEVQLERELRYRELAIADLVGSTAYHLTAVGLVIGGWGVWSLAWATLAGSLLRAVLLQRAARWRLGFRFRATLALRLLRAGLPLQVNEVVGRAPGWITPTLVAALIGPEGVGFLTWAATVGRKPLELLQNVTRVSLTHFARLQHDLVEVERVLHRYAVASLLGCGLWFSVLVVAGRDLVGFVYTDRWLPAVPALLIFAGGAMIASVRWLAASALLATGRGGFTARVTTISALVSIAVSVVLVLRIGLLGVPIGQLAGILVATPLLLYGLRRDGPVRMLRVALPVFVPMTAAFAAGTVAMLAPLQPAPRGLMVTAVMLMVFIGAAWYAGPSWLRAVAREEIAGVRQWPIASY